MTVNEVLNAALTEWAAGHYYEAHEHLEELLEALDLEGDEERWMLALIQVAASLHKLVANVAPRAVPGKLERALVTLADAPATWRGLDLIGFRGASADLLARLGGVEAGGPIPPGLTWPTLTRAR